MWFIKYIINPPDMLPLHITRKGVGGVQEGGGEAQLYYGALDRKTINFIFNLNMSLLLLHRPPTMYNTAQDNNHCLLPAHGSPNGRRIDGYSKSRQLQHYLQQIHKHFTTLMTIYEECDFNLLTSGQRCYSAVVVN